MATYNGERFLNSQLDSYLNQEKQPDELVVSDDVSRDESPWFLCQYMALVHYMHKAILVIQKTFFLVLVVTIPFVSSKVHILDMKNCYRIYKISMQQ